MAKLPKSIIKKYGISKKAWRVYRAGKAKRSRARAAPRRKPAKRRVRRASTSRGARKVARTKKFRYADETGAFLYGLARAQTLGRFVGPVLDRVPIPGFQYLDEAGMFAFSWALKTGKIPIIKKFPLSKRMGKAGMMIEAYRVGAGMGQSGFGFQKLAPTQNTGQLF